MTVSTCEVAIVGAGPYGLATAAHLGAAGVQTQVFGEPMGFWRRHMPVGMLLRSPWEASHISDPQRSLTLDRYERARGVRLSRPIPLDDFVEYGEWFQREAVPGLDRRTVTGVEPVDGGFKLTLEDGESLGAARVVVAAGLAPFGRRPPPFDELPAALVSHSSDYGDLARLGGSRVVVVGAGQSALESTALLHEAGAEVEVVARAPGVHWLGRSALLHRLEPVRRLLYAPTDVGPAVLSWVVATPSLFRRLPLESQVRLARRSIRPAGAAWLKPRLERVPITTGASVVAANMASDGLILRLSDGSERRVDHVVLATGYGVEVSRYPFLSPELLGSLRLVDGYPKLTGGFESSVPGLHFVGAPAAWSFGPLMRFVAGTDFTARAVARGVVGKSRPAATAIGRRWPAPLQLRRSGR
jgi:Pyridine nucleotide-disulphide oxidoreductase